MCGVCVCVQYLWTACFEARIGKLLKSLECLGYQCHIQLKFVYSEAVVFMQYALTTVLADV